VRVTSPIGDLPFEVTAVRREGRELVVEGSLGAWRSQIHVGAGDVPMLARALRGPLAAAAVAAAAVVVLRRR
jgi:hypothetical protein